MLNVKIIDPDMAETIVEAEQVRYEPRRTIPDSEAFAPATLLIFGQLGSPQSPVFRTDGTAYVMNDKGRTIGTYHLTIDNAVAGLSDPKPVPPPPYPPHRS